MGDATPWPSKAAFLAAHLNQQLALRFWVKADTNGPIPTHRPELGRCWLWTAAKDKKGYGYFCVKTQGRTRMFTAHRVASALSGEVPADGIFVCHHCDNPSCVNPAHLFTGTHEDNMTDMVTKGRTRKGLPTCGQGHSLEDPANVRLVKDRSARGGYRRVCITCANKRAREFQRRKRASVGAARTDRTEVRRDRLRRGL